MQACLAQVWRGAIERLHASHETSMPRDRTSSPNGPATHEPLDVGWYRGVPDIEFMAPQDPEVAGHRDRHLGHCRRRIFVGQPDQSLLLGKQPRQLLFGKRRSGPN